MIAWYLFPCFFTALSGMIFLAAMIIDSLAHRYLGQEFAHIIVWCLWMIINLSIWLICILVYR